jgi:chromate reductase, NAD(P)H dehydrogenase (quinone)
MPDHTIAVIVGSLRKESLNRRLADALPALAPPGFAFTRPRIDDLPPYNQDQDDSPPPSATRLKQEIAAATGVIFVTPEYNRSIPGVLKNAIDHASRPYGQSAWQGKPAGLLGISPGAPGTSMAQQHLRLMLAYLDMPTLGQPEVYLQMKEGLLVDDGKGGTTLGADSRKFLQGWMDRYVAWVRHHAGAGTR